MKRLFVISLVVSLFCTVLRAENADSLKTVNVERVEVKGFRSLRDIGTQKSPLSQEVLGRNIATSIGDILSQNSPVFVKSSGRATLSTASLRGTAPSHTAVSWNGVELGSPMLGMVDLSMIPSFFVDGGEVYLGATSVGVTGGGLGGAVVLTTDNKPRQGLQVQYNQNIASYRTFDEYLRVSVGRNNLSSTTRLLCSSSANDFPYINRNKVGHPTERNRSCDYNDLHLLEELAWQSPRAGLWSLKVWYTDSHRGVPKLTVDYREDDLTKAWQDERSLRSVGEWSHHFGGVRLRARGGYNQNGLNYVYQFSKGGGEVQRGVDATSLTHHLFATADAEWSIGNNLMLAANVGANRYNVDSHDVAPLVPTGYTASRNELSARTSARWKPTRWLGVAANLREEWRDGVASPLIPALFVDVALWPEIGLIVSSSVARNYHHPTLNDLYYVPGGNPDLQPEQGTTYDLGAEFGIDREHFSIGGKATYFRSDVSNWILWNPTIKGFWTPENLARVESRGVEARLWATAKLGGGWSVSESVLWTLTNSTDATPESANFGNQLPYIPRHSLSATTKVEWHKWSLTHQWRYVGRRQTNYSGSTMRGGYVEAYHLHTLSLERQMSLQEWNFRVRLEVDNLLNADYQSVLSRPMPPRNYALCIEVLFGH